jgi:purine-binding chemotaxis protein CheW
MFMIADDQPSRFDWEAAKERLREVEKSLASSDQLTSEQSARLLQRRAKRLAQVSESPIDTGGTLEVVCFQLGVERIAVAADCVMELVTVDSVTPIPQSAEQFIGITNLRGHVTAIIDLCVLMEIPRDDQPRHQALVLGRDEPEFGIAVDGVDHVRTLRLTELVPSPITAHRELIMGITSDGLLVLAGDQLIDSPSLYINETD